MELRHLRYFVHVAEELHFGRAAVRLGISQPPLSQQIQALEHELGVQLFARTNRHVELTDVGRLFLPEARATLAQADRAVDVARRAQRGEIGRLAIGMSASTPFADTIQRAIFAFRAAYPKVEVQLAELPAARQIELVNERQLDVGFIRSRQLPLLPDTVSASELFTDGLIVALRGDHRLARREGPIPFAELADDRFVLYPRGHGADFNDQLAEMARAAGFELKISQEARELSTLLGLVGAGFGVTVVSASLQALKVENLVYKPLKDPQACTTMWMIHYPRLQSMVASVFMDYVRHERV